MRVLESIIALVVVCVRKNHYLEETEETETRKMNKKKLKVSMEVLNEVSVEFPGTKQFIEKRLEHKCSKENISIEEVICFFFDNPRSKELAQQTFLLCSVRFSSRNLLFTRIAFN